MSTTDTYSIWHLKHSATLIVDGVVPSGDPKDALADVIRTVGDTPLPERVWVEVTQYSRDDNDRVRVSSTTYHYQADGTWKWSGGGVAIERDAVSTWYSLRERVEREREAARKYEDDVEGAGMFGLPAPEAPGRPEFQALLDAAVAAEQRRGEEWRRQREEWAALHAAEEEMRRPWREAEEAAQEARKAVQKARKAKRRAIRERDDAQAADAADLLWGPGAEVSSGTGGPGGGQPPDLSRLPDEMGNGGLNTEDCLIRRPEGAELHQSLDEAPAGSW